MNGMTHLQQQQWPRRAAASLLPPPPPPPPRVVLLRRRHPACRRLCTTAAAAGPTAEHQQQEQQEQQQQNRHQKRQGARPQQQHGRREPVPLLFQGGSGGAGTPDEQQQQQQKQQQQQQAAAVSAALTARLTNARDVAALAAVVAQHDATLSAVHVSAALSRASRLCPNALAPSHSRHAQQHIAQAELRPLVDALLARFLGSGRGGVRGAGPVELSCIAGALARLGYAQRGDVAAAIVDATRPLLLLRPLPPPPEEQQQQQQHQQQHQQRRQDAGIGSGNGHASSSSSSSSSSAAAKGQRRPMTNKELLQLAWALARLGHTPDDDWVAAFGDATLARLSSLNSVETANAVWAFAKWGAQPSAAWVAAFLRHLQRGALLDLRPQELSSVVWSAAVLQLPLPPSLVDSLLLEAQVKFGAFDGYGFSTLAWALARLDVRPKRVWLRDFVARSAAALPALARGRRDQPFTNLVWALGCWGHAPPPAWLQEFCRCVVPQLAAMTPQGLSIVAVGLAELRHLPPRELVSYMLELFHRGRERAAPQHAVALLWALPRLLLPEASLALGGGGDGGGGDDGAQGPAAAGAAGRSTRSADGNNHNHSRGARQQPHQPQQPEPPLHGWLRQYAWLLQDLCDLVAPQLGRLTPAELVDAVAGLSDVGFFPGAPWMDAHEGALNARLDGLTPAQVGLVKRAYRRLEALSGAGGGGGAGAAAAIAASQGGALPERAAALLAEQQAALAQVLAAVPGPGGGGGDGALQQQLRRRQQLEQQQAARLAAAAAAAAEATSAEQLGVARSASMQQQQEQQQQQQLQAGGGGPRWLSADAEREAAWAPEPPRQGRLLGSGLRSRPRPPRGQHPARRQQLQRRREQQAAWAADGGRGGDDDDDAPPPRLVTELDPVPQLPRKPRAARVRLEKLRVAERAAAEADAAAAGLAEEVAAALLAGNRPSSSGPAEPFDAGRARAVHGRAVRAAQPQKQQQQQQQQQQQGRRARGDDDAAGGGGDDGVRTRPPPPPAEQGSGRPPQWQWLRDDEF